MKHCYLPLLLISTNVLIACQYPLNSPPPINHSTPEIIVEPPKIIPTTANIPAKSSVAIINFIGKVTLKKANDLTSYVYKQFGEGVTEFVINLNSSGGDTAAGISVYQFLKTLPISITTNNLGNVQSSAAMIYCSGDKRYSLPYSFFMLHGSATTYSGGMSLTNVEGLVKLGKIHLQAFTEIFKNCSTLNATTLETYFSSSESRYFTALEAKEMGLVQKITAPEFVKTTLVYNIAD